jgi:cysteine desulfurase/selenocysteine lyase
MKMQEKKIQKHFNARYSEEIILTSGTTHSINLVASGFTNILSKNDEILISELEHHSNIVPWQMMCKKNGAKLKVIPLKNNGDLNYDEYLKLLSPNTKLVFVNHVSNALGTINPIDRIISEAHKYGAVVLIDGAQASSHLKADMQKLNLIFIQHPHTSYVDLLELACCMEKKSGLKSFLHIKVVEK